MSELISVGKTMKGTYESICGLGFLDQFPGSDFRNESALTGLGEVYVKIEFIESFNLLKEQMIEVNGSFPIL